MKRIISLAITLFASSCYAEALPVLPSQMKSSPHRLFITSESDQHTFDSWKIDSGYAYNVFDRVDLYVGTRLNNNKQHNDSGFLSGVSYQVSPRLSLKSTLHSYSEEQTESSGKESKLSAEISSRMKLTDNLDIHATLDYQEWQQGVEVGLGFRF